MAGEGVASPIIQVFPGADVACGQGGATFEGNPAHSGIGLISSSPPTITTSNPNLSGAALSIPHEEPTLQRTVSSMSFVSATTDTAVGRDGSPNPGTEPDCGTITGEPIVDEPGSMEGPEVVERSSMEVPKEVYLGTAPVNMWMTARYKHEMLNTISEKYEIIDAFNKIPIREKCLGSGWYQYVHPEGRPYFRNENLYTNEYLYDPDKLHLVERARELLHEEMLKHSVDPADVEAGLLMYVDDDGDDIGCYYLCNMRTEEVFYMAEVNKTFFCDTENAPIVSRQHLGLAAQKAYWEHVFMFPHGRCLSEEKVQGLLDEIGFYRLDRETSSTSTAPYDPDLLHRFHQIIKDVRPHSRMMTTFLGEKVIRYYGERCAQLEVNQSIRTPLNTSHPWWFILLNWVLFWSPHVYAKRLRETWVDQQVNYQYWTRFIQELQGDWLASITPTTVVLTANVGFLAIQSIDSNPINRSAGQIVSYMSLLLSIGNIFACMILGRQHRLADNLYADDGLKYLAMRALTSGRIELLSALFSIPTALFLWSLLSFAGAIAWECFWRTSNLTRAFIGVTLGFSALILGMAIRNGNWDPPTKVVQLSRKMNELGKTVVKVPKRASTMARGWSTQFAAKARRYSTDLKEKAHTYSSDIRKRARSSSLSTVTLGQPFTRFRDDSNNSASASRRVFESSPMFRESIPSPPPSHSPRAWTLRIPKFVPSNPLTAVPESQHSPVPPSDVQELPLPVLSHPSISRTSY